MLDVLIRTKDRRIFEYKSPQQHHQAAVHPFSKFDIYPHSTDDPGLWLYSSTVNKGDDKADDSSKRERENRRLI